MTKMSSVNKGHAWQTQRDKHNLTCLLKLRMMNFRINRIIVIVITFSVVQREYNRGDFYPCQLGYWTMRETRKTHKRVSSVLMHVWKCYSCERDTRTASCIRGEMRSRGPDNRQCEKRFSFSTKKKRGPVSRSVTHFPLSPFSRIYHNKRTKSVNGPSHSPSVYIVWCEMWE